MSKTCLRDVVLKQEPILLLIFCQKLNCRPVSDILLASICFWLKGYYQYAYQKKHEGMFILWELFLFSTETHMLLLTHNFGERAASLSLSQRGLLCH